MTDECNLADRAYAGLISDNIIIISKPRYEELLEEEKFLNALRAAGVDNWDGWDFAIDMLEEDE